MADQFTFGAGNERIEVHILGFAHSPGAIESETDKSKTDRLDSTVRLVIGAFSGSFKTEFSTKDLMSLRRDLLALLSSGSGKTSFKSVGNDLSLEVQLLDSGNAAIGGSIRPHTMPQATLDFKFDLLENVLAETAQEVEDTFREFPNPTPATV